MNTLIPRFMSIASILVGSFAIILLFNFLLRLIIFNPQYDNFLIAMGLIIGALLLRRGSKLVKKKAETQTAHVKSQHLLYDTQVDGWEATLLGTVLTTLFFIFCFSSGDVSNPVWVSFLKKIQGPIPIITIGLFFIITAIATVKLFKILDTGKVYNHIVNSQIMGPANESGTHSKIDSFLHNRMTDTQFSPATHEYFLELDREELDSSYTFIRFLVWAIPVMGFIGTVWGISGSINKFTVALSDTSVDGLSKDSLAPALGDLSIAFDTTLVALSFGILAMLCASFLQKHEEKLLTRCHILLGRRLQAQPPSIQAEPLPHSSVPKSNLQETAGEKVGIKVKKLATTVPSPQVEPPTTNIDTENTDTDEKKEE